MKYYILSALLLVGLAGCGGSSDTTHHAVSNYIKKNLGDPASYQEVRWGKTIPYLRSDAEAAKAMILLDSGQVVSQRAIQGITDEIPDSIVDRQKRIAAAYFGRATKIGSLVDSLRAKKDSATVGSVVVHAFRAKNKMGALVLDSARFIVLKTGEVTALKPDN